MITRDQLKEGYWWARDPSLTDPVIVEVKSGYVWIIGWEEPDSVETWLPRLIRAVEPLKEEPAPPPPPDRLVRHR